MLGPVLVTGAVAWVVEELDFLVQGSPVLGCAGLIDHELEKGFT